MPFLFDSSPYSLPLTASGATLNTTFFKYGSGSAFFDGVNDFINFPNNQLNFGSGDFTIEFWAYKTTVAGSVRFLDSGGREGWSIELGEESGTQWKTYLGELLRVSGIGVNKWVHVAFCRSNGVTSIYFDGILKGSVADPGNYTVRGGVAVLGTGATPGLYYQGYVDDLRITKGLARYTTDFSPPSGQLSQPFYIPAGSSYTTFGANPQNNYIPQHFYPSLFVYEGDNVAFLVGNNFFDNRNYPLMENIVRVFDEVYDIYKFYTGRDPTPTYTYKNKLTIASVSATCGAGCGLPGYTGIEIESGIWNNNYVNNLIRLNNGLYDQLLFYEFGRNFWFNIATLEGPGLEFSGPFAIFMRFITMEKAGVQGAPFNGTPFQTFKNTVINMINTYIGDPAYTWDNTFAIDQGVPNPMGLGPGVADLAASLFYDLYNRFGETWLENIWKRTAIRPNSLTQQDVADNFAISSTEAVNANLVTLFTDIYKWPLSTPAREYMETFPPLT